MIDKLLKNTEEDKELNIKELFFSYLIYWKLFLLTTFLSIITAFIYLKISIPNYDVTAKVILKEDDNKSGISSELGAFSDLTGLMSVGSNNIENEIEIFKSRSTLYEVVKKLKLNVLYYDLSSKLTKKELFNNKNYNVEFLTRKPITFKESGNFIINPLSDNNFEFENVINKHKSVEKFGRAFHTNFGDIIIFPNGNKIPMEIAIQDFEKSIDNLQKNIIIEPTSKEASVIELSIKLENIDKGKAILNTLINIHSQNGIDDKNQISKNTLNFINERLNVITKELSFSENNVSNFKSENKIFDLTTNANLFFENQSENEKLLIQNSTQIKLAEYIISHAQKFQSGDLLPSNLGINNVSIENKIESFNAIQLERNKLLLTSNPKNPLIINIDYQLNQIRNSLIESLNNQLNILKIENKEIEKQNNYLNGRLKKAPQQEKDFKEIYRQQQIKEGLYIYLLQKKEETSISLAVTVSKTKTIEDAYSNGIASSPKRKIIYLVSIISGIIIPFVGIYLFRLFDTKIHSQKDFTDLDLPLIGDIPISDSTEKLIIKTSDRSSVSEAFRLLRTNINFINYKKNDNNKTILITSTISKEGKSFTALNLAAVYGLSGKKTILIGLDLRAPKLLEYLDLQNSKGVTDYIVNENLNWKNLVHKLPNVTNVDLLNSGTIPPNPAELLLSERLDILFEELKDEYEYIIVDSAPIGMVADTYLLSKYSDILIYVCRLNYMDKRMLYIPKKLFNENNFKNMVILMNGSNSKNGYGYGYGYGYGESESESDKKKWWKK